MELIPTIVQYAILPLLTAICTIAWSLFKKHDIRLDTLEKNQNDLEKAVIEIKAEFKYISRDIKEIKDILHRLDNK